ncbi:1-acyl-sn-glycerol-3-phosphate acyltransferase [Soonwooa sp.]|uniref:1-acyl-sn-glycerol-3-phosphate acyltransferase n=1 Tax=Soonwooa sp. TaxID=1938592 RepID=UPI002618DF4A|nr:1-acyl-sn-glycerol-3-phosphate acyltransferase [Soonwooa sp.]
MQSIFENIRFYNPEEVQSALLSMQKHPMMQALLRFTFPQKSEEEISSVLKSINSIEDFQSKVIRFCIQNILSQSSEGLKVSGLENLDKSKTYLFISNHRDIVLDTSLLNLALLENDFQLTASAIGDNLVQRDIFMVLARLNRNFLVSRDVSPRELLKSSQMLSEYIKYLVLESHQNVWIAQREGRTKDGNDNTHPGVLKMLAMANGKNDVCDYFEKLNLLPVSISYEFDPTDKLKTVKAHQSKDIPKDKNEDFNNVMAGVLGQKKHIHIHFGKTMETDYSRIKAESENANQEIQNLAKAVDKQIIGNYHLFPTNFIAYDVLTKGNRFSGRYSESERDFFVRRLELNIDKNQESFLNHYLGMYANPVKNKLDLGLEI